MRLSRAALMLGVAALPLAPALAEPARKAPPRPAAAAAPGAALPAPIAYTHRTLANGLRFYAIRDTSTANVAIQLWYDVGGKNDPKGRSGFAHMFEHLMFKATRNLPPEAFDRMTEDVGGYNNASTNPDYTNYFEVIPANHLERLLFAEAERMSSLVVDPKDFASERDVVKEELRLRVLASPYGRLFYLYFPEVSYQSHPYGRPVIGSLEDLQSASIDDVRAFHATYYRPDNAVLVVAGNFDPAQLDKWIDQYFAPIKKPDYAIPRVKVAEPPRTAPKTYTVYQQNVPLPAVMMSFQIPADRDPDSAAIAVLDTILSQGDSSRLYQSLVYSQQVAAQAGTFLDSKQDTGAWGIYSILAGGKTPEAGEAALRAEIAKVRTTPVTAEELARAKNQILTNTLRGRETADGKALTIANAVIIDGDASAADRQLAAIAKVTAADVLRVAKKYLDPQTAATIRYLPAASAADEAKGDKIGLAPTVQIADLAPPANVQVVTPASDAERVPLPKPGPAISPNIPTPQTATLANGMKLVVVEKHDLPLLTASVIVPSGSNNDPAARAGIANMTATLLTKGTATRSATQVASQIEALGGSIGSDSGWDSMSIDIGVKSDQIAKALPILADSALHPAFAQDELDRSRKQVLDGINVQLKNPGQLSSLLAGPVVFGGGPFGHLASGTPKSLAAMTRDGIVGTYRTAWRPDKATLVMVGDVTLAQAKQLAQANFGSWTAPASPAAATPTVATPAPRVVVVDLPGTGQAGVVIAKPGVARNDPDFYASAVANAVLGGGYSSRLNQEIRIKRGLAYGASSGLRAGRTAGVEFAATQTKNPSATEVVGLMIDEMKKLAATPANAGEIDSRKAVLIGGFGRQAETTGGMAGILGSYISNDVPLSEISQYIGKVSAVSPAQVQAAAGKLLDPGKASIVIVGDAKLFIDDLRKAYPNLDLIPADKLNLDSPTLK